MRIVIKSGLVHSPVQLIGDEESNELNTAIARGEDASDHAE